MSRDCCASDNNRGRGNLKRATAKIEVDQHAHATMSRSKVVGWHDKTGKRVHAGTSRVVQGPDRDR